MRRPFCSVIPLVLMLMGFVAMAFAAPAAPTLEERQKAAAELDKAYAQLSAIDRAVPRETFDPGAIMELVGRDEGALLAWVRTNTQWVPYRGALKGPEGVLMDRLGSSCDRALLLAELLSASGHEVRLAHATLDDAQAAALLAAAGSAAPPLDAPKVVDQQKVQRVERHAAALQAAVPALASAVPDQAARTAAAKDHWWVQRHINDAWVDLDPNGPADKPLTLQPSNTFPYTGGGGSGRLPADFVHEVDVRVVIEAWEDGKLIDKPVLEAKLRPAEMVGQRIFLRHHPVGSSKASAGKELNDDTMKQQALAQTEWMPILQIPARLIAKKSFTIAGVVNDNPNLNPAAKVAAAQGKTFGGFGAVAGGNAQSSDAEPATVLTAEWMEFTIHSPGREPQTIRREVFDVLGPAARAQRSTQKPALNDNLRLDRALVLNGFIDTLPLASNYSRAFLRHNVYQNALAERRTWLTLVAEPDAQRRAVLLNGVDYGSPLAWFAGARTAVSPVREKVYIDTPNFVSYHAHLRAGDGGKLLAVRRIDIVNNPVAARPGVANPAAVCAAQGVADTAAEDFVLRGSPDGATGAISERMENTMPLLDAAAASGTALSIVNKPDAAPAEVPADAKARLVGDLAAGYAVVAPSKIVTVDGAPRFGWWRVKPMTGEAVGVMDQGFHSDTVEYNEDTYIADTHLGDTRLDNIGRGPNQNLFWKRHARVIARDLGYDPMDMDVLNVILDRQWEMFASGVWL